MNRASKNESASTSGSDREAPSEGSLKHTVLTSSLDLGSFSEISLMVDFTNNCIMYKRANFILVNIYCGSGSAQSYIRAISVEYYEKLNPYWMIALQSIPGFIVCLHVAT